jgi:hypothetical protein
MAQSALAVNYVKGFEFITFIDMLNTIFYGNCSIRDHEDLADLLSLVRQLDDQWINALYFNGKHVFNAVRGDSGQFLAGDASPFAPQCNSIVCDMDGDDLMIVVRSSSTDFEQAHMVAAWTLENGSYQQRKYSFIVNGSFCMARIVGGARHRHVFFALMGPEK